ncbi:hypothetical protein ABMY20_05360 [Tenacibaculum sp. SSH1-16]|uniref:hypothetical protein n=1 Tax=Tenacibaculum sp. SSH1-16 TaxID=3136667 RepID=UPI0032C40E3F|nr:hypothetical protein BACT7_24840 [Tenacibaculum mesophilum]
MKKKGLPLITFKLIFIVLFIIVQSCQKSEEIIEFKGDTNTIPSPESNSDLQKAYEDKIGINLKNRSRFGESFTFISSSEKVKDNLIHGVEVLEDLNLTHDSKSRSFLLNFESFESKIGFLIRFVKINDGKYTEIVSIVNGETIAYLPENITSKEYLNKDRNNMKGVTTKKTCYIDITKCKKVKEEDSSFPIPLSNEDPIDCIIGQLIGELEAQGCTSIKYGKTGDGPYKDTPYDGEIIEPEGPEPSLTCSDLVKIETKLEIRNNTLGQKIPQYIYLKKADIGWVTNTNHRLEEPLDPRKSGYRRYNIIGLTSNDGLVYGECEVEITNSFIRPDDLIISSVLGL